MRNTYLRFPLMITGVLIAVLLGIHMTVLHLNSILAFFGLGASDPKGWIAMIARAREATWAGIYIALLAVGLFHALTGFRGIVLEVTPSPRAAQAITWVISIIGVLIFIGGSYVPVALLSR
ncbi:MAG: hypothetical protein ABIH70_05955 [Chloroflexota bacterium]